MDRCDRDTECLCKNCTRRCSSCEPCRAAVYCDAYDQEGE